jgi:hypothetical protein
MAYAVMNHSDDLPCFMVLAVTVATGTVGALGYTILHSIEYALYPLTGCSRYRLGA